VVYFTLVSAPNPYIYLSSRPYALHVPPISVFSILSLEHCWVRSTLSINTRRQVGTSLTNQSLTLQRQPGILSYPQPKLNNKHGSTNLRSPGVTQSHTVPTEIRCDSFTNIKNDQLILMLLVLLRRVSKGRNMLQKQC
jgi:hypothetical protein